MLILSRLEKLPWCECPFSFADDLLEEVDCDQRLRFPIPSRILPMLSTATWATLDLRVEEGGVAFLWGFEGSGTVSFSEADRLTVTTEEDETELDLEDLRWWMGAEGRSDA